MKKIFTLIAAVMMAVGSYAENKSMKITTTGAKTNQWDSQVIINFPTPLEAKKYTMTMELKGDAVDEQEGQWGPVALQPVFQDNNSTNRDQWDGPADLQYGANFRTTVDWSDLKDCGGNPVTTDGKFPYSRVALNLGRLGGSLYIDNLKFIDENGVEAFCITFDTPEEQALVAPGAGVEVEYIGDSAPVIDDYMVKVDIPEKKENGWDSQLLVMIPTTLQTGKHYHIMFSVKGSVASEECSCVLQDTESTNRDQWGGTADVSYSPAFKITTEWSQVSAFATQIDGKWYPVSDARFPYNRLVIQLGKYAGTVYFDNFKFVEYESGSVITSDFKDGILGKVQAGQSHVAVSKVESDCPSFDTPTAIKTVNTDVENSVMYNIAGQRVQNAKGIVIKNGKKYVF